MLDRFLNLFKGHAQGHGSMQVMPVGHGITITVDAKGDMVFTTCIEILAKQIAQLKWSLYGSDNKEVETLMKQFRFALNQSPYPGINAFDFWGYMEKQRLSTGNALAYIATNEMGFLQHLVPLDGSRVKIYWDNANSYGQDIYAVLGAHVAFDLGKVQLNLWGKNLTDTNYNTFAVDNAATGKREYFAQRGNPFQCGVDVSFRF